MSLIYGLRGREREMANKKVRKNINNKQIIWGGQIELTSMNYINCYYPNR